jgi:TRAP-type uncharacterized transport system substrate-binding protein
MRTTELLIGTTNVARGRIAAAILLSLYQQVQRSPRLKVGLLLGSSDSEIAGMRSPLLVGKKKIHFGFANPAGLARMALLGKGVYKKPIPLRAIGVFPTWDRLVFAVRKDTGLRSLDEIKERKYPLRVSTRAGDRFHSTLFAIDQVLKQHGFTLQDIQKWGGKIIRAASPSTSERASHIEQGEADAVFDEGIKSWGSLALKSGMRLLPLSEAVLRKMKALGFPGAPLTPEHYPELGEEIPTVDFSGWLFFCHRDLPSAAAYKMAEAIDLCHSQIPVDGRERKTMTMREFCQGGEGGPMTIPLHLGARRYYKAKGYLETQAQNNRG